MRILIITVAGMSTRFSKSVGNEVIKCLYHENSFSECLLYRLIHQPVSFDKYVIVGGYRYNELENAVKKEFSDISDKIVLIKNDCYEKYGSGYSLYYGIKKAFEYAPDEIVFSEGDLYVDEPSFVRVTESEKSVISCNTERIMAEKSVAMYLDMNGLVRYIYDTAHSAFEIKEPFLEISNSGQIWKFSNTKILYKTMTSMSEDEWKGTNLVFIEKYFRNLHKDEYEIVEFRKWINCNTISDYNRIQEES